MADSAAFESVRRSSDYVPVAVRATAESAGIRVSGFRRARGLLRPSRLPVPGAATRSAGFRPLDLLPGFGRPLAAPVREEMEARLGADFSQVRVHADSAARASAAGLGARAYTVGDHVVIGGSGTDKHVLAHELTHVIQQRQGQVAGTGHGAGFRVSDPFDGYEKAAEASAARVMRARLTQHRPGAAGISEPWTSADRPGEGSQQVAPLAMRAGLPAVQRVVENAHYADNADEKDKEAAKVFFDAVNKATLDAYKYAVSVPSLGGYVKLDGHTAHWGKLWAKFVNGGKPKLMAAAFGYVVESLVTAKNAPFTFKIPAGYSVAAQVTKGGTRPDLILSLQKGFDSIAWLDLTASGSVDHIFQKDGWDEKVSIYAEVTYPSLTPATLALMRQNKDNKGQIDPEEFKKRLAAAEAEHSQRQKEWREIGKELKKGMWKKILENAGLKNREVASLGDENPGKVRKAVAGFLKDKFRTDEEPDVKMVPSILSALGIDSAQWHFTAGFSESLAAGEAWLIDNPYPEDEQQHGEPMDLGK